MSTSDLAAAIDLATRVHQGQVDKAGAAYIGHPLRVMVRVVGRQDLLLNPLALLGEPLTRAQQLRAITAVLHDVVEDSDMTLDDLLTQGFPPESVAGVDAVTTRDGETHHEAVVRASKDPVGCDVKSADVEDNTDPERMQRLPAELRERLTAKYAAVPGILAQARAARA